MEDIIAFFHNVTDINAITYEVTTYIPNIVLLL